jgi:hypothetical protein
MDSPSTFSEPLKYEPLPLWVHMLIILWLLVYYAIEGIWKILVFIRKEMKREGILIGIILGWGIALMIGFILKHFSAGLNPYSMEYSLVRILFGLILWIGPGIGAWVGYKISSKLYATERRS